MIRLVILTITIMILSLQSSCQFRPSKSLEYNDEFDNIVVFAKERTIPGGGFQLPFCNELPALTIYGDGSVIRRSNIGSIEAQDIRQILELLESQGFFSKPVVEVNPAGTGIDLTVYLKSGAAQSSWNFGSSQDPSPEVYQQILDLVKHHLKPYVPENAILLAVPYHAHDLDAMLPAEIPDWPAERFGFSLSDVPQEGRSVEAQAAGFVWQAIKASPLVTRFRDGDQIFATSLYIPGILDPRQSGRCW